MIGETIEHHRGNRCERCGEPQRTLRGHVAEECEKVVGKKRPSAELVVRAESDRQQ